MYLGQPYPAGCWNFADLDLNPSNSTAMATIMATTSVSEGVYKIQAGALAAAGLIIASLAVGSAFLLAFVFALVTTEFVTAHLVLITAKGAAIVFWLFSFISFFAYYGGISSAVHDFTLTDASGASLALISTAELAGGFVVTVVASVSAFVALVFTLLIASSELRGARAFRARLAGDTIVPGIFEGVSLHTASSFTAAGRLRAAAQPPAAGDGEAPAWAAALLAGGAGAKAAKQRADAAADAAAAADDVESPRSPVRRVHSSALPETDLDSDSDGTERSADVPAPVKRNRSVRAMAHSASPATTSPAPSPALADAGAAGRSHTARATAAPELAQPRARSSRAEPVPTAAAVVAASYYKSPAIAEVARGGGASAAAAASKPAARPPAAVYEEDEDDEDADFDEEAAPPPPKARAAAAQPAARPAPVAARQASAPPTPARYPPPDDDDGLDLDEEY